MTQLHNTNVCHFVKIPEQPPPSKLNLMSRMHYAEEDAAPLLLPLELFVGDKNAMSLCS